MSGFQTGSCWMSPERVTPCNFQVQTYVYRAVVMSCDHVPLHTAQLCGHWRCEVAGYGTQTLEHKQPWILITTPPMDHTQSLLQNACIGLHARATQAERIEGTNP